jgi:hypothetical protein
MKPEDAFLGAADPHPGRQKECVTQGEDQGLSYAFACDFAIMRASAAVFRHACAMGLEGIVSKRLTAPYRSGPCRDWIKVKNPDSPAMIRHREGRWEK